MGGPYSARFYWISGELRVGPTFSHDPVMVDEVVDVFAPIVSGVVIDCTVGGGGHAAALLANSDSAVEILGIDRDPMAVVAARVRLEPFGERARVVRGDFREVAAIAAAEVNMPVTGVLMDLGVSSPQLDMPARGLSHTREGPLDMRMDPSATLTAADVVNTYSPAALRRVISVYGDENYADRIARAVVKRRRSKPFETTTDFAEVVRSAIPAATRRTGRHPARRTFQAIRIEVNDELGALDESLDGALSIIAAGGRIAVMSYHSLEDRAVKHFFKAHAETDRRPRGLPVVEAERSGLLREVTRKPIVPSAQELASNPRSASARLRVAERTRELL